MESRLKAKYRLQKALGSFESWPLFQQCNNNREERKKEERKLRLVRCDSLR